MRSRPRTPREACSRTPRPGGRPSPRRSWRPSRPSAPSRRRGEREQRGSDGGRARTVARGDAPRGDGGARRRMDAPLRPRAARCSPRVGAVALTAERATSSRTRSRTRGGMRRDEARGAIEELADRWRGERRAWASGPAPTLHGMLRELGLVAASECEELELRVAQLEHRLRLLERDLDTPLDPADRALASRSRPAAAPAGRSEPRVQHCRMSAQPAHAQPRPPVRDRAGRRPARLRLLLRDPPADRPAAVAPALAARASRTAVAARARTCARCSTSSGRRSSSSASCSRRGPTSCRRTSSPSCAASRTTSGRSRSRRSSSVIEEELGLSVEQLFLEFDDRADRRRLDRPGAPRGASERPPRRRQGAAARTRRARSRPTSRSSTRPPASRRSACARSTSSTRASSSTSSRARSGRSSTTGSRRATRSAFHRNFAGDPHVRVPRVYWSYTRSARAHARACSTGMPARRRRARRRWTLEERRRLAYLMAETWMTMIFRHGFFHGDPHPANILVLGDPTGSGSSTSARSGSSPTTTCRS